MKLQDWAMRDALVNGDADAAVRGLQEYFGLDLSIDRIDFQEPSTWGVVWGIEIVAGKPWNTCYSWFEDDSFASYALISSAGKAGLDTRPATVRAIIWKKI